MHGIWFGIACKCVCMCLTCLVQMAFMTNFTCTFLLINNTVHTGQRGSLNGLFLTYPRVQLVPYIYTHWAWIQCFAFLFRLSTFVNSVIIRMTEYNIALTSGIHVRQDLPWASLLYLSALALPSVLSSSRGGEFTLAMKSTHRGFQTRKEHTPGYSVTSDENNAHMQIVSRRRSVSHPWRSGCWQR